MKNEGEKSLEEMSLKKTEEIFSILYEDSPQLTKFEQITKILYEFGIAASLSRENLDTSRDLDK